MDDMEDDEKQPSMYDEDNDQEKGLFRWMSAFVVLLAVAGFFGLAWYAYKGGDTAVDEKDVELVKADTTPLKEAPANPGGMQIPNQDKTVYSLINGNKTEKPVAERILPAPEEPVARSGDTESWVSDKVKNKDVADAGAAQQASPDIADAQNPVAANTTAAGPTAEKKSEQFNPAKIREEQAQKPSSISLADSANVVSNSNTKTTAANTAKPTSPSDASGSALKTVDAGADVPTSAVPDAVKTEKPVEAAPKESKQADDDSADNAHEDKVDAASKSEESVAKGIRAQLGAYKSEAEAKSQWKRISNKFSEDLQGKQYAIVRADLGAKGIYYRLQVLPFKNSSQAEEFCLSFVSAGQGCFSVNVK